MVKKFLIGISATVLILIIFMFSTLNNRHTVFMYYRMYDFHNKLNAALQMELTCEQVATLDTCFQKIVSTAGGYQFGSDYGVSLGVLFGRINQLKGTNSPALYKVMSVMLKKINPEKFWINQKTGKSAKAILSEEKAVLSAALQNNRITIVEKLQKVLPTETKVEIEGLLKTLDEKIIELETRFN